MDINNAKTNIKRFFSNPNTLTFILVIGLIVVIYFIYNYTVNRAISPVTVPYATKMITSKTKITNEMIGTVKISGSFVTSSGSGLIQSKGRILNKYVAEGYQIPQNSFFYTEAVVDEDNSVLHLCDVFFIDDSFCFREERAVKDKVNTTPFTNLPDNYAIYNLAVDFHSTYGCSVMPGNYIDLYFKAKDTTSGKEPKVIFELFIKSIQVYRVVDKDGIDVFSYGDDEKEPTPKYLYFAVPNEVHRLLKLAEKVPKGNIEIIPVPRNAGYSENPEETVIANEAVENFILSQSEYISE